MARPRQYDPVCTVEGCERKHSAKGYCAAHYQRLHRSPEAVRESARRWRENNRDYQKRWYQENKERQSKLAFERTIRRKYGLAPEEYRARLAAGCSLCGATDRKMHMDHCHATGKVREALCAVCNTGLGAFHDDPELLRAAAAYIEKHRAPRESK
jgi:hypothetical protein